MSKSNLTGAEASSISLSQPKSTTQSPDGIASPTAVIRITPRSTSIPSIFSKPSTKGFVTIFAIATAFAIGACVVRRIYLSRRYRRRCPPSKDAAAAMATGALVMKPSPSTSAGVTTTSRTEVGISDGAPSINREGRDEYEESAASTSRRVSMFSVGSMRGAESIGSVDPFTSREELEQDDMASRYSPSVSDIFSLPSPSPPQPSTPTSPASSPRSSLRSSSPLPGPTPSPSTKPSGAPPLPPPMPSFPPPSYTSSRHGSSRSIRTWRSTTTNSNRDITTPLPEYRSASVPPYEDGI